MENKKPISEWTLVEMKELCRDTMCAACSFYNNHNSLCNLKRLPSAWELPQLTENELAICKALGAKWVSKDDDPNADIHMCHLWIQKPIKQGKVYDRLDDDNSLIAFVNSNLFPSVKHGDCIGVEETGGK